MSAPYLCVDLTGVECAILAVGGAYRGIEMQCLLIEARWSYSDGDTGKANSLVNGLFLVKSNNYHG